MKRSLVLIPLILLVLLNACDTGRLPPFSAPQWTAIAATQEVMLRSQAANIKSWLNPQLDGNDQLEQAFVANYQVFDVTFQPNYETPDQLQVSMNCQCVTGSSCCTSERMFVVALSKMVRSRDAILATVPATVQWMLLICYDSSTQPTREIGRKVVHWKEVEEFLRGYINAYDLKPHVSP
jgi:hypothetical protein